MLSQIIFRIACYTVLMYWEFEDGCSALNPGHAEKPVQSFIYLKLELLTQFPASSKNEMNQALGHFCAHTG